MATKKMTSKPLGIPVLDLYDALRGVKDAASKDDTRPHIACVRVCAKSARKTPKGEDGQLDLVATNGHVIYVWRQQLKGAVDREFSLTNRAVTRILRELTDIRREHLAAKKMWGINNRFVKKGEKKKPEPEEPTITFFERFYRHPLGSEMRLDLVDEKYPPYERILADFVPRTTAPPSMTGINSAYLVQVCKSLQRVTGNKNIGLHVEFDKKGVAGPGGDDLAMMRFTVPPGASYGNPNTARQLTCLVMPMRI